jgi:hypothetical protein
MALCNVPKKVVVNARPHYGGIDGSPPQGDNSLKDHRPMRIRIQTPMESSVRPPKMRTSYPSPALVFVIVGVIVAAFVMFLVVRPH